MSPGLGVVTLSPILPGGVGWGLPLETFSYTYNPKLDLWLVICLGARPVSGPLQEPCQPARAPESHGEPPKFWPYQDKGQSCASPPRASQRVAF